MPTGLSRSLRQHRLGFIAALAIAALVLGYIGYREAGFSISDAAYGTLSLLAFNYTGPSTDIPLTLELARFMVPAVTAFATFTALVVLLEDEWHLVRARLHSKHLVICGLGQRGLGVLRSLSQDDQWSTVVVIEPDRANPNVRLARRLGAIVVVGDATDGDVLHAAGVDRADTLISLLPDDSGNAAVALAARDVCARRKDVLNAFCHVADMDLVQDLNSASARMSDDRIALEWFSVPERAARLLLSQHSGLLEDSSEGRAPHLAIVGSDELARALVINAAREWRAMTGGTCQRIKITIAWEGASAWVERLLDRHPSIDSIADVAAFEPDLRAVANERSALKALRDTRAVFVCAETDTDGLEIGFAVSRILGPDGSVVVRLVVESGAFVELLDHKEEGGSMRLFSVIGETCSAAMITHGLRETLAAALHAIYLEQAEGSPDDARPTEPWHDLDEKFKRSNRAQAREFGTKLSQSGCRIRALEDWDATLLELSEAEVDRLAKVEHDRWSAERKQAGWVWGPETDREANPPVNKWIDVPFEELPPEIAEYDRAFVRELPRALAAAGYEMYRAAQGPPLSSATSNPEPGSA